MSLFLKRAKSCDQTGGFSLLLFSTVINK
ncbi:hypothetical protein KUCAC02_034379 [Chaenocephalus aceratus]|nr:hypothetical protein KUCAC02_034379 [Chaenocephalus aceratus]